VELKTDSDSDRDSEEPTGIERKPTGTGGRLLRAFIVED
jgi:hypothetical protein